MINLPAAGSNGGARPSKDFLTELRRQIESTAGNFRRGEAGPGFSALVSLLDSLDELAGAFSALLAGLAEAGGTEALEQAAAITAAVQDLNATLAEIMEAMGRGDPVLIADLLEYELVVKLDEWQALLGSD
ncbi:MAG: hypothetical protein D9V47_13410 [Clostridia bacterium]|nr:MAG: hypothetical protein D9V47_13410 [Clostridia bacterium]